MPLSPPLAREPLHTRHVECRGYRRGDGLWDIEGHLVDVKTYDYDSHTRGRVVAGTPVHDMWIRLTVDDELVIRAVEAVTDGSPYPVCPSIAPNYQRLKGISLKPGFTRKAKEMLGGTEGCTHLLELLGPIATTAFQTIFSLRHRRAEAQAQAGRHHRPRLLNTCHAFASDGEQVRRYYPEFYTGPEPVPEPAPPHPGPVPVSSGAPASAGVSVASDSAWTPPASSAARIS